MNPQLSVPGTSGTRDKSPNRFVEFKNPSASVAAVSASDIEEIVSEEGKITPDEDAVDKGQSKQSNEVQIFNDNVPSLSQHEQLILDKANIIFPPTQRSYAHLAIVRLHNTWIKPFDITKAKKLNSECS